MFIEAMDGVDCRVNGRFSAGINIVPKFSWSVLLCRAPQGFQGEARRNDVPWVPSPPRHVDVQIVQKLIGVAKRIKDFCIYL